MTTEPLRDLPDHHRTRSGASLPLLAVGVGLGTGLAEDGILAIRKFGLHRFIFQGRDVIWMAPLADLLLFAVVAVLLLMARRLFPRLGSQGFAVGLFTALSVFTLLLHFGPLHPLAGMCIAAGIGMQVGRLAARAPDRIVRWTRVTAPALAMLVALLWGGLATSRYLTERKAGQGPVRANGPNVLLLVLDTVRSLNMSLYGYGRPTTPELERWARRGVRFELAFSTAPWTLPSHASMFTGRFPHEMSADWLRPLDGTWPTLAGVLGARGYATAGMVGNTAYCSYESGLARGFAHYEDYQAGPAQLLFSSALIRFLAKDRATRRKFARKDAEEVNREFLAWLDDRKDHRPFFAFLNYMDAHEPYQPPPPFDATFGDTTKREMLAQLREEGPARQWTPPVVAAAIDAYDGSIAYIDAQLGALFQELDRRHLSDSTIVILVSDHGEEFGEHGVFYHGNSLYRASISVPLVIVSPGRVPSERTIPVPVSLRDVAATIMSLAQPGVAHPFPGISLERYWLQAPAAPDTLLAELNYSPGLPAGTPISKGPMRSLVADSLRVIRNGDGRLELYNFDRDPGERRDLGTDTAWGDRLAGLAARLAALSTPARGAAGTER